MLRILARIAAAFAFALIVAALAYAFGSVTMEPETLAQNVFTVDMTTLSQPSAQTPIPSGGGAAAAAPKDLPPIAELLAKADPAAGEKYAKICTTCHSFGKGEPAKLGPNLYGVIGLKHAHMEGYAYSDAMKALSDKIWTMDELNHFLYSPRGWIAGTKMPYAGIKNDSDRANVIAWLRTVSDHPEPLPSPAK